MYKTVLQFQPGMSGVAGVARHRRHESREKKIGHRRVDQQTGQVTYKKVSNRCNQFFCVNCREFLHI